MKKEERSAAFAKRLDIVLGNARPLGEEGGDEDEVTGVQVREARNNDVKLANLCKCL